MLVLGAIGAVFGDLGTSPLYAQQAIFSEHADAVQATPAGVYGVASLVFWTLIIIASVKYAGVIMRAHNHGDGGVMALTALLQRRRVPRVALLTTVGLVGAGLFVGDAMITPAITVTSAMEGLTVAAPGSLTSCCPSRSRSSSACSWCSGSAPARWAGCSGRCWWCGVW